MRLKIVAPEKAVPGRLDGTAQIFLDGRELKNVASIELSLMANEVNRATITFYPTEVRLEGEFDVQKVNKEGEGDSE